MVHFPTSVIKRTAELTCLIILSGCADVLSATTVTTKLNIAMTGNAAVPEGAVGTQDPIFQLYTLKSVVLTKSDGTTVTGYDGEPIDLRIISRPQIITTYDMATDAGVVYSSIAVTFDSAVTGAGRYQDDLAITLDNPVLTYDQPFTVAKAQDRRLDIWVNWQNTVSESEVDQTNSIQAPSFTLTLTPN
ncbi:MAG: hypothetical protein FJ146_14515 [Deltaproteobacteria bacterium]|nr:hypothetical protein [Deltaproteobacteria bacterium]